jgi:hypothetical protein
MTKTFEEYWLVELRKPLDTTQENIEKLCDYILIVEPNFKEVMAFPCKRA